VVDEDSGVASVSPQVFQGLNHQGSALSDHDPIVFDIALQATCY
jgi:hypothetical protein